ncbi:CD83 antigen [Salminus brasiliensis]|uniref:CD83 antigen n=1 Tax=Salminus brasiliensis TaxID=930266 RepID=UPI003B8344EC
MSITAVVCVLLFTLAVRASVEHVALSVRGGDAVLRCLAEAEPSVRYQTVIWYKVSESPTRQLSGLVMKRLNNGTVQRYKGLMREVELLGDSHSLLLPNVTQQDTGKYLCFLSASIGHHNQEREINLRVFEQPKDENIMLETRETQYELENDTPFVVLAIILLIAALLMFYCSYICLRNTLISHKEKFSKPTRLKGTQQMKQLIVSLTSKGVVSKLLPEEYV